MKFEIKRISVWSAVKITFLLSLVLGFLVGIFYALLLLPLAMLPMGRIPSEFSSEMPFAIGGIFLIILPFGISIFSAIFNTIGAAIFAVIYNLIVRLIGGIEIELEEMQVRSIRPATEPPQPPTMTPTDGSV